MHSVFYLVKKSVPSICVCLLFFNVSVATSFRFVDTHPINHLDSLENWVKRNKTPNTERLKSLIQLERTYTWVNKIKFGSHHAEILSLSTQLKNETGIASYWYLRAYFYYSEIQGHSSVEPVNKALLKFENLHDTSGLLHCYGLLTYMLSNSFGEVVTNNEVLKASYEKKMAVLMQNNTNPYDIIEYHRILANLIYTGIASDYKKMRSLANNTLHYINKHPNLKYAVLTFTTQVAISYWLEGDFATSYKINKKLLATLNKNYIKERVDLIFNFTNDCYDLRKIEEGMFYSWQAIDLLNTFNSHDYEMYEVFYDQIRYFATLNKNYDLSSKMMDSVINYMQLNYEKANNIKMLEQQSLYEFERKQHEISVLEYQKNHSEEKNKYTILLLIVVTIFAGSVVFFAFYLHNLNQKLNASHVARERMFSIIAHDLRRPMHAFQGMNEMINYYLKQGDYKAIEKLSEAIDTSGIKLQKLLDNLLSWALSQREELPYNPSHLLLLPTIESVIELYEKVNFLKNITIEIDCPADLIVYMDVNALELILRNLLDNSFKAIPQNGTIEIVAKRKTEKNIELVITDNAGGIAKDKLEAIQTVFNNPMGATIGENGLGMGLVMVARFMRKNKGKITIQSHNATSIFTLLLPA